MKRHVNLTCLPLSAGVVAALASLHLLSQDAEVKVQFNERLGPLEMDHMALGQGGQSDQPMWDSRIAEVRALKPRLIRLFIQEYFDLLPAKGQYHFGALDRSVGTILKAGARPLMCICFKPRVLFPAVDQAVVEPNDYAAWDKLVLSLVRHFKQWGHRGWYWEVANEPDIGESGGCPYLFEPDSYLRYYRHTAQAILRADAEAKVGGPALANVRSPILPALLQAAEKQKLPLHFVSWHIYSSSPSAIRGTSQYVRDLLKKYPALKPETVLDEWNMDLLNPPLDARFQPCYVAEVVYQMKEASLDYSCYYQIRDYHVSYDRFAPFMSPTGTAFMTRWWNRMPQFDGLFDYQDNVRPAYFAFKLLARLEGQRLALRSTRPAINGFATRDDRLLMENVLLWNFSDKPAHVTVSFDGLPRNRRARHVVLEALASSSDENARLRPEPYFEVKAGAHQMQVQFEPYALHYWSLE
jgi:hypothetical protein